MVDADVESACNAGAIVRTHVLRPTWHFVDPADLRWLLALTGPRVHRMNGYAYRRFELDAAACRRGAKVVSQALSAGTFLTRAEIGTALEAAGLAMAEPHRLAYMIMRLELDAVICSGPRRGKQFTWALLEERVPPAPVPERDASLALLATRYFATRGPATAHDFSWWSGLTVADARRAASAAGLEQENRNGVTWWHGGGGAPRAEAAPRAHLLPNYDEYFIGFRDRSSIGTRVRGRTLPSRAFWGHVIIVDGQLVGDWRRELARNRVAIELNLLSRLGAAERNALASAAAAYGAFLELPAAVTTR